MNEGKMKKKSVDIKNQFIPHPMQLFLVGTYDENKNPNIGMFCWISFCWDGELSATVCMDGQKTTKDHIMENGMFSACLVTEEILPLADLLASTKGLEKEKLIKSVSLTEGEKLSVPMLQDSPLCYELKVKQTIHLDGSEIFICSIENTMVDEEMVNAEEKYNLAQTNPALVSQMQYFGLHLMTEKCSS